MAMIVRPTNSDDRSICEEGTWNGTAEFQLAQSSVASSQSAARAQQSVESENGGGKKLGEREMAHGASSSLNREKWTQLIAGIICMIMIANLQYGWTLFVHPINAAHKDWSISRCSGFICP
nr:hypothetical protein [Bradyrhizobium guangzhouense]